MPCIVSNFSYERLLVEAHCHVIIDYQDGIAHMFGVCPRRARMPHAFGKRDETTRRAAISFRSWQQSTRKLDDT